MKTALNSLGCPDWSFDTLLDFAASAKVDGLEIRGIRGKMRAEEIEEFFPENQSALMDKLHKAGVKIVGFGASSSFHDPRKCDAAFQEAKEAVNVCQRLGIGFVRVFGNNIPDPQNEKETVQRVAEYCRALCDHALSLDESSPVTVLLEAHGDFNTAQRLHAVCTQTNRSNFGIIWDIAHTFKAYGCDHQEFYRVMKPYIKHVHFKDLKRKDGGFEVASLTEGDIPLDSILDMLRSDGFDGYISLEHEKKWHPELPEPEVEFEKFIGYMKKHL